MKANKNDVKALKSLVEKYGSKDVIGAVKALNENNIFPDGRFNIAALIKYINQKFWINLSLTKDVEKNIAKAPKYKNTPYSISPNPCGSENSWYSISLYDFAVKVNPEYRYGFGIWISPADNVFGYIIDACDVIDPGGANEFDDGYNDSNPDSYCQDMSLLSDLLTPDVAKSILYSYYNDGAKDDDNEDSEANDTKYFDTLDENFHKSMMLADGNESKILQAWNTFIKGVLLARKENYTWPFMIEEYDYKMIKYYQSKGILPDWPEGISDVYYITFENGRIRWNHIEGVEYDDRNLQRLKYSKNFA